MNCAVPTTKSMSAMMLPPSSDAPESYQSMVDKRVTDWPQSCMVPGILQYMDLPDVYEAVAAFKPFSAAFVSEPVPEV